MGKSSPSKQTTTTEPPKFIQPYMQYGAQQAQSLYNQGGPQYYPGQTVVPFSPQTERAMGMTEQRAINGSPVVDAAQNYTQSTLSSPVSSQFGGASNPFTQTYQAAPNTYGGATNPMLDATFNRAADSVQQRLQGAFSGGGRDIQAGRPVAAQELNDLSTSLYGGAYENERNRQLAYDQQAQGINANAFDAAQGRGFSGYENERNRMMQDLTNQNQQRIALTGMAPQLASQDYADINALGGVGQQVEDLSGRLMQDNASRWDFAQNAPQTNLDQYMSRINGAYPGGTQTTPVYQNHTAGALGGALGAASLGGMLSLSNPWTAGLAGIGGLLGAL